ncbi:MAG: nucleotidyltransferase domain-containing protein [Tannerella sp.]|jgi:predicted nucleotidyltransferase|nr:nucleotidyltransferase domain-containing protein [Tannerella sp.]
MDKGKSIELAQHYIDKVSARYKIRRAFLFGSYAKGNHHADSDIDVAIVFANVANLFDTQIELMQLRRDGDLIIEPHVFREEDFTGNNPLVSEIIKNNIELAV